jgi:hypothetical protein
MHQSLKQFLMYASLIALVGTTACSTLEASFGADEGDGGSATHASSDILQSMARDSEAGGE